MNAKRDSNKTTDISADTIDFFDFILTHSFDY